MKVDDAGRVNTKKIQWHLKVIQWKRETSMYWYTIYEVGLRSKRHTAILDKVDHSINKAGNILYIQGYFYICILRNRGVFQPSIKTYHNGQFELYIPQPQVLGTLRSPWLLTTSNGMILQVDTGFYTSHVVIAGFQPWTVYVLLNQDQHQ